jgi:hypothetical protein
MFFAVVTSWCSWIIQNILHALSISVISLEFCVGTHEDISEWWRKSPKRLNLWQAEDLLCRMNCVACSYQEHFDTCFRLKPNDGTWTCMRLMNGVVWCGLTCGNWRERVCGWLEGVEPFCFVLNWNCKLDNLLQVREIRKLAQIRFSSWHPA